MNSFQRGFTVSCIAVGSLASTHAATPPDERITVGYRLGFGISARFGDNAGFAPASAPGPATGGDIDRNYDDGFNRVDVTGNAGGKTWNWGYNNSGQAPGNDFVTMSSATVLPAPASPAVENEPYHGVEMAYSRSFANIGPARVGFEIAVGYMPLKLRDTQPITAATSVTVDAYSLSGVIAPVAPYAGSFNGPGPLLSDSPIRTFDTDTSTISGYRELKSSLYSLRVGPTLELPIVPSLSLNVSGGLAFVYVEGEFAYSETAVLASGATLSRAAGRSNSGGVVGGYLSGGLSWQVSPLWSLFGSAQFVSVGDYTVTAGARTARLELGHSVFVTIGVGFSF